MGDTLYSGRQVTTSCALVTAFAGSGRPSHRGKQTTEPVARLGGGALRAGCTLGGLYPALLLPAWAWGPNLANWTLSPVI